MLDQALANFLSEIKYSDLVKSTKRNSSNFKQTKCKILYNIHTYSFFPTLHFTQFKITPKMQKMTKSDFLPKI